jgi:hypothetical protein
MAYNASKAATYNKLIKQGLSQDAAAAQAGITDAETNDYVIGMNGELGAPIDGGQKIAGVDYDKYTPAQQAEAAKWDKGLQSTNYDETASGQPSQQPTAKPVTYTTTSTETVSGGGSTTIVSPPGTPNSTSQKYADAYAAKNAEYNQFVKDNPSDFIRKKDGLPPMTPDEKAAYTAKLNQLNNEKAALKSDQINAETTNPPIVSTTPNTTTTTQTVSTVTAPTNDPVNIQNDDAVFQQAEVQLDNTNSAATAGNSTNLTTANEDPYEAARLQAEQSLNNSPTLSAEDVPALSDDELAVQEAYQQDQRNQLASENFNEYPADVDPNEGGLELPPGAEPDGPPQPEPYALNPDQDASFMGQTNEFDGIDQAIAAQQAAQEQGSQQAAITAKAKQQATLQARYKQPGNTDWRVRLSLAPGAQYLYNATPAGVLAPLKANGGTDGVIFPYTPSINTTYSANYEQYDLTHSNYRGLFYKNSRVGDIQIRGTFTAQDTTEANYLLAVIHFFRSATKMFYGQDEQRGAPPPICLLNGFGGYQFSDHPVVISAFNYTLPNDVDYIRTTNPNNFGLNLVNRYNPSGASLPAGGALAGVYRLLNAIPGGLPKGALPPTPAPNSVAGSVTNNTPASYVPTKMEIDITLIPVQTRSQVSQQFSLKGFANGDLIKGGFW